MAKQTFTTGQVLTAAQMTSLQQTAMLGGAASAKTASYTLVAADAGTAISMSNAGATTITVNTALFAAGDTVHITNLGAGVCTITAGTATVNSSASLALAQYESGFLDFTSSSAAIFVKGAGAAAASGGMTLLSTTSLSGTATTISSISGSYKNLQVIVRNLSFTSGSTLNISSNITNSTWIRTNNAITYSRSQSSIALNDGATGQGNNTTSAFSMNIYDYAVTSAHKTFDIRLGYNTDRFVMASGFWQSNDALTSLTFTGDGTDTFNGGSVLIYGVN